MRSNAMRRALNVDVDRLAVDHFNAKGNFNMEDLDKKDPLLKHPPPPSFLSERSETSCPVGHS